MAANIAEIRTKVQSRIQDDAGKLTATALTGDIDLAILAAVAQYSNDRPREVTARVAGAATHKYALDGLSLVLASYLDGFSRILELVYPHDTADQDLEVLEADEWSVRRMHDGLFLWFTEASPAVGEYFLARYTAVHSLGASSSTIPACDDEALVYLGAAICCDALAACYTQTTDSSLSADVTDRLPRAEHYRSLARSYREAYQKLIGGGDQAVQAAGCSVELDGAFGNSVMTDRFFHGKRRF